MLHRGEVVGPLKCSNPVCYAVRLGTPDHVKQALEFGDPNLKEVDCDVWDSAVTLCFSLDHTDAKEKLDVLLAHPALDPHFVMESMSLRRAVIASRCFDDLVAQVETWVQDRTDLQDRTDRTKK